jgi:hypothetical protein
MKKIVTNYKRKGFDGFLTTYVPLNIACRREYDDTDMKAPTAQVFYKTP